MRIIRFMKCQTQETKQQSYQRKQNYISIRVIFFQIKILGLASPKKHQIVFESHLWANGHHSLIFRTTQIWQGHADQFSKINLLAEEHLCIVIIQMKANFRLVVLILGLLAASTVSQDLFDRDGTKFFDSVEGARHPHIYTTIIYAEPDLTLSPLQASLEFTGTITEGTFDSSEEIYTASAIFSLDINSAYVSSSPDSLTFFVESLTVNAARTSFTVVVSFLSDTLTGGEISQYDQIGLSIILIGSGFSGQSNTVESSYIYAKNSKLHNIIDFNQGGSSPVAQFDFKQSPTDTSPFNYLPTASLGAGCGAIRKSGKIIIETSGCDLNNFYGFVTGFVNTDVTNNFWTFNGAIIVNGPTSTYNNNQLYEETETTDPADPGYIFKQSASDQSVGLWMQYTINNNNIGLQSIQVSFIYLGIRDYNSIANSNPAVAYPVQNALTRDTFIAISAAVDQSISSTDPFVLTMEADTYTDGDLLEDFIADEGQFGHAFCGFLGMVVRKTNSNEPFLLDIEISASNAEAQKPSNSQLVPSCFLLSQRTQCTYDLDTVAVGEYATDVTATGTAELITSADLLSAPIDEIPSYKAELNFIANEVAQGGISINYGTADVQHYELHVYVDSSLNRDPADQEILTVTVQGEIIYQSLLAIEGIDTDHDFLFYINNNGEPLTVEVSYGGVAGLNAATIQFQVAISEIDQVLNDFDCLDSCPARIGFQVGVTEETETFVCIYCNTALNQVYNPLFGECVCADHFTEDITVADSLVCIPCPNDPLCTVCAPDTFICEECEVDASLVAGVCTCNAGFYRSGSVCVECPVGCVTCSSATVCTACEDSTNDDGIVTRGTPATGCQCLDGFFEVEGEVVCEACDFVCETCNDDSEVCTSCDETGNFVQDGTTCVCQDGFYLLETDTGATCQPCDDKCQNCAGSSIYCTSCSEDDFRELQGTDIAGVMTCACIQGYIEFQGECVDTTCQNSVEFCQTCLLETQFRTTECLTCVGNRVVVNGFCECAVGFYEAANGECLPCGEGCQYCLSASECSSCALRATPNGDGSCSCSSGFIIDESAGTLYCRNCDFGCSSCVNTFDTCSTCKSGFILNSNNKCVCPEGFYLPSGQSTCQRCLDNCLVCSSATTCTTCAENFVWNQQSQTCTINCPVGTFDAGSRCEDCPETCTDCVNEYICIGCQTGFNLFAGSCRQFCPSGTFAINGECLACSNRCQQCSGTPESCITCTGGLIYFQGACVSDCPAGTYYGDNSCLACSPRCLTCQAHTDKCTSCLPGQFLYDNNCYSQCPVAVVEGVCTNVCPDGTYFTGSACADCDSSCETCSGAADSCTSCSTGFFSFEGDCIQQCPAGTLARGTACLPCDQSCQSCVGSLLNCVSCAAGYVRLGSSCVERCGEGFFVDANRNCQDCGLGCRTCSSATSCSACFDTSLTPVGGVCQKTCPPSSVLDANGECTCRFGYLYENACVSSCPLGTFASGRICQACAYPCASCTGTANTCLTCATGFTYLSSERRCLAESNCNYGQFENAQGVCTQICFNGVFYNTACIPSCPAGFRNNGFGGCVEASTTFCQAPLFQQGSNCVSACSTGYFANVQTRICEPCPANCQACPSTTSCSVCSTGFALNSQNQCVQTVSCPNGYLYNNSCLSVCPVGTTANARQECQRVCRTPLYYDPNDGFCYPTCRTTFRTSEACVNTCPAGYIAVGSECRRN